MEEASDKEICKAVIDLIAASQNIDSDDANEDSDDIPIDPRPTRRDVLKAVSTISRYTDGLNDPVARKFEANLSLFSRLLCLEETTSMKGTVLTGFFQRSQMVLFKVVYSYSMLAT